MLPTGLRLSRHYGCTSEHEKADMPNLSIVIKYCPKHERMWFEKAGLVDDPNRTKRFAITEGLDDSDELVEPVSEEPVEPVEPVEAVSEEPTEPEENL